MFMSESFTKVQTVVQDNVFGKKKAVRPMDERAGGGPGLTAFRTSSSGVREIVQW